VIVVDASALTDFLLGAPSADEAFEHALGTNDQAWLHAPELIEPETLNALRRLALAGHVSDERAGIAALELGEVRLVRHPHAPLRARVWELRHELTAYDATYLALAEALDGSVLVTGDAGLAARARRSLAAERVIHSA
jgi:predicted nucleic acid-binding protein